MNESNDEDKVYRNQPSMHRKLCDYPPMLDKACYDPFQYAIGLSNGTVIQFESAIPISREWIHIDLGENADKGRAGVCDLPCPRGIDVRVDSILWVADAPAGS